MPRNRRHCHCRRQHLIDKIHSRRTRIFGFTCNKGFSDYAVLDFGIAALI
jgi:hypothetical protein